MSWITGIDLGFQMDHRGCIEELTIQDQSLWTIGDSFLPALELALRDGTRRIAIQPQITEGSVEVDSQSLKVRFTDCVELQGGKTWAVEGFYTMEIGDDGTISWHAAVENHSNYSICEILFPRSMPIYFSETGVLMYPHHAGECIVNVPQALASEKYQEFWRAGSVKTDFGFAREINYCGLASMTWMDITDGDFGMYVGSHDPSFPVTGLRVETGGPEDPWVSLGIRKYIDIDPGKAYSSSPVIWAFHSGDWHQSAERYRAWFDTVVKQSNPPEDLKHEVVVSPHYNFRRFEGIGYRFQDIPTIAQDDRDEFQSRHFFIAGWNHMGFDSHYPNYNPDLELGTPLVLQQGVEAVNDSGGFVTFYINSRIMDKYSEYTATLGEEWMLRTMEQKPIEEVYGPAETFVLCPSNPGWRKHLLEFAVWMCRAYGARGIYYDQLGSAEPYPCYSNHDHGDLGTGGFNQGYMDLLERTTAGLRDIRSDSFLMIENCGDIYSSRVWGNVAWNGPAYDEFFNLYKYTFPEHTLINMVNPRRNTDPEEQEEIFYQDLYRAFVLGSVFWFEGNAFRTRVSEPERRTRILKSLREALDVRRAAVSQLSDAVFQDDLGLTLPEGVLGTRWQMSSLHEGLVLLVNRENREGRLQLAYPHKGAVRVRVFDSDNMDWTYTTLQAQNGELELDVPAGTFSVMGWHKL